MTLPADSVCFVFVCLCSVVVSSYSEGYRGTVILTANEVNPPANDLLANREAVFVATEAAIVTGTTVGATPDPEGMAGFGYNCSCSIPFLVFFCFFSPLLVLSSPLPDPHEGPHSVWYEVNAAIAGLAQLTQESPASHLQVDCWTLIDGELSELSTDRTLTIDRQPEVVLSLGRQVSCVGITSWRLHFSCRPRRLRWTLFKNVVLHCWGGRGRHCPSIVERHRCVSFCTRSQRLSPASQRRLR